MDAESIRWLVLPMVQERSREPGDAWDQAHKALETMLNVANATPAPREMEALENEFAPLTNSALRSRVPKLEGDLAEAVKVLKWALPLAERAIDDHRLERVRCGHSDITGTYKNGVTWCGIYQSEVDEIEAARATLGKLNRLSEEG